ncbi:hypothetical protein V6N13_146443 [Hibiscus sabdariffa]|uniref:Uncharacterized protein n=1 Tax=Hibiscus sabdariffa TaxID=183260 RepID=A0ABR2TSM3_9ROSI
MSCELYSKSPSLFHHYAIAMHCLCFSMQHFLIWQADHLGTGNTDAHVGYPPDSTCIFIFIICHVSTYGPHDCSPEISWVFHLHASSSLAS